MRNLLFIATAIGLMVSHHCFANSVEALPEISQNLVLFTPEVVEDPDTQPCQGILLDRQRLKTTSACALKAVHQQLLNPHEPIELTGVGGQVFGELQDAGKQISAISGLLRIYPTSTETELRQPELRQPELESATSGALNELNVHYLGSIEKRVGEHEPLTAITEPVTGYWEADQLILEEISHNYPPGAVITKEHKLLCVINSEGKCPAIHRAESRLVKRQISGSLCVNNPENADYFYDCRERNIENCGSARDFGFGGVGGVDETIVLINGTCINPVIKDRCVFISFFDGINNTILMENVLCPTTCVFDFEYRTFSPNATQSCSCVATLAGIPPHGGSFMYPSGERCIERSSAVQTTAATERSSAVQTTAATILMLTTALAAMN